MNWNSVLVGVLCDFIDIWQKKIVENFFKKYSWLKTNKNEDKLPERPDKLNWRGFGKFRMLFFLIFFLLVCF
jgi:hypothetical protein